jgi:hypothetical protein
VTGITVKFVYADVYLTSIARARASVLQDVEEALIGGYPSR